MTTFVITRVRTDGRVNSTTVDGYEAEPLMLHLRGKYTADKHSLAVHIFQDGHHYSSWQAPSKEDPPWPTTPHPTGTFEGTIHRITGENRLECRTACGTIFAPPVSVTHAIGDRVTVEVTHDTVDGTVSARGKIKA